MDYIFKNEVSTYIHYPPYCTDGEGEGENENGKGNAATQLTTQTPYMPYTLVHVWFESALSATHHQPEVELGPTDGDWGSVLP